MIAICVNWQGLPNHTGVPATSMAGVHPACASCAATYAAICVDLR